MNILIIDDHPLLRSGLGRLFAIEFDATIMILAWNLGSAALLVGLGVLLGPKVFSW